MIPASVFMTLNVEPRNINRDVEAIISDEISARFNKGSAKLFTSFNRTYRLP